MKPIVAAAEDFRRVGIAGMIAGIIGSLLEDKFPLAVGVLAIVLGVVACSVGYWLHHRDEGKEVS